MASRNKKRKPYSERSDSERVAANWRKTLGLFELGEFSVSIIRAATATELMANLALRHELVTTRKLSTTFVDRLLEWANGVSNKHYKLLLPILEGTDGHEKVRVLSVSLKKIASERNKVAHRGEFKKRSTALESLVAAHNYISGLATMYAPTLQVTKPEKSNPRSHTVARRSRARR